MRALPSTRLRLNLAADLTEDLTFRGRLVTFKNWGDSDTPGFFDLYASRRPSDSDLKVERAYVNFFFGPEVLPLALTFGRMPLSDGLPTDLREDSPRKSTYPSLTYDVEGDGVAISVGLERLLKLPGLNLKYALSEFLADNDTSPYRDAGYNNSKGQLFQLETNLPGALRDTIVIVNHVTIDIAPADLSSLAGYIAAYLPERLGRLSWWTYFMESKDLLGSGLDLFAGYASQDADPKGLAYYRGPAYPESGTTPFGYATVPIGLLNQDGYTDQRGCAWHVGGRYTLPLEILNEPKLGVEFNHGSKYWLSLTTASEDPLDKLSTRGSAWDFYYIQPFNKYFSARLGYTRVHQKYANGGARGLITGGVPYNCRRTIENAYALLDVKF